MLCGSVHNHEPGYIRFRSKERRCVRCRRVFCRIDIGDGEPPIKAVVGGPGSVTLTVFI
jgi:hypothetical protein